MTTPPLERDKSGRFVKAAPEVTGLAQENAIKHPVAKLLFGWVEGPRTSLILLGGVIALLVGVTLIDLLIDRPSAIGFAGTDWFYPAFGFAALAFTILFGWPLGKLLRRDEDYYGEADTQPDDIDPEAKQ